jgi:hypothetical protein
VALRCSPFTSIHKRGHCIGRQSDSSRKWRHSSWFRGDTADLYLGGAWFENLGWIADFSYVIPCFNNLLHLNLGYDNFHPRINQFIIQWRPRILRRMIALLESQSESEYDSDSESESVSDSEFDSEFVVVFARCSVRKSWLDRRLFRSHSLFSPHPCYLVPLSPKYTPQHPILKHPQPTFLPQCQRSSFTPIQTTFNTFTTNKTYLKALCQQWC